MKVAEVWSYEDGAFPSPPTFVPRVGAEDPDDGYVVVLVHRDGDKEVQVFDASHIEAGPLARATAPGFNPNLMLHSTWMPPRRPSSGLGLSGVVVARRAGRAARDARGARIAPAHGPRMAAQERAARR
jgi:hypothetical protein